MSAPVGREERVLGIIDTARAKRARFRDKHITLAHGAGGKASQTLIEGLLVPALGGGRGARWPRWATPEPSTRRGRGSR